LRTPQPPERKLRCICEDGFRSYAGGTPSFTAWYNFEMDKKLEELEDEGALRTDELRTANRILKAQLEMLKEQSELINLAYDAIIVQDISGTIMGWNVGAEKVYGWKEEEVLGKHTHELLKTKFPETDKAILDVVLREGKWEGELLHTRRDGREIVVASRWVLQKDKLGNPVSIIKINRDITEKKKLEEKVASYTRELENRVAERTRELEHVVSEVAMDAAKNKAIFESIGDGVIVVNEEGKIVRINPRGEEMMGVKAIDLIGQPYTKIALEMENGESVPEAERPLYNTLSQKKTVLSQSTYYLVRKDKTRFPVAMISTPIEIEGRIIGAIDAFRDITREKEIDRAKSEFISIASHQLRTPLTTLSWYTESLLSGREKLTPRQSEYLTEIKGATARLLELVASLLNISRIELGTFSLESKVIDVVKICREIQADMKTTIKKKKLKIRESFPKDLPVMKLDMDLVRVVFQNLFSNAVKYTPKNGFIYIGIERVKNNLIIKMQDSGCGIPKNDQKNMFNKFFRAENSKILDPNGNGLGLYITKTIVEYAKGKIWFESEENKGTTFFVDLPTIERRKKPRN